MSIEEDTELRDLISQTLEVNGCFAKIRAQLRASIYLALDDDHVFQKNAYLINKKLQSIESNDDILIFSVVREFLEFFDLEFTLSVFESESHIGSKYKYDGREKLIEDLNIPGIRKDSSEPILLQLIQFCKLNRLNDTQASENSISSLNYKNYFISQNSCDDSKGALITNNNSSPNVEHCGSGNVQFDNNLNLTFNIESKQIHQSTDSKTHSSDQTQADVNKEKLLIDFDKSIKPDNEIDVECNKSQSSSADSSELLSPIVKDTSKHSKIENSFDKIKLSSPKCDKIKIKNNLSDLPPLQTTKPRVHDMLLPSLYSKDFKDRNNLRDLDKLFDLEPMDNYEEDFMSESEIDLTLNKQRSLSAPKSSNSIDNIQKDPAICENAIGKDDGTSCKDNESISKNVAADGNSTTSSVTSEDFEMNSNIDDILNSC